MQTCKTSRLVDEKRKVKYACFMFVLRFMSLCYAPYLLTRHVIFVGSFQPCCMYAARESPQTLCYTKGNSPHTRHFIISVLFCIYSSRSLNFTISNFNDCMAADIPLENWAVFCFLSQKHIALKGKSD